MAMHRLLLLLFVVFATGAWAQPPDLKSEQPRVDQVQFDSASRPLGRLQERLARERGEEPKPLAGDRIQGFLAKPQGEGPFPAVLILHGCGGLSAYVRDDLPRLLASWGYVALAVDSLTTRKLEHVCTGAQGGVDRVTDAYGALFYLASQSFVDRTRVGLFGISNGAIATLSLAEERDVQSVVNPDRLGFRAGVAYYPLCGISSGKTAIPLLIMIGQLDQWTRAGACEELLRRKEPQSAPMDLVIYPNAHHGFVVRDWGTGEEGFGFRLEYNEQAAQDSLRRAREFLSRHLGG